MLKQLIEKAELVISKDEEGLTKPEINILIFHLTQLRCMIFDIPMTQAILQQLCPDYQHQLYACSNNLVKLIPKNMLEDSSLKISFVYECEKLPQPTVISSSKFGEYKENSFLDIYS